MASSSSAAAGRRATTLLGARTPARLPASPRSCSAHTRTPRGSMMLIRMRADVLVAADLPPELLGGRIIAALDAASRLALFRCSHALARLVLVHAPGSKRLTHLVSSDSSGSGRWSPTLADLIGSRWQPLPSPLGLELRITSSDDDAAPKPPLPSHLPPAAIRQHTNRLHLEGWQLSASALAAWQLHSPTLWPHLQHLTIRDAGRVDRLPTAASLSQLQPIPGLQSLSFRSRRQMADGAMAAVLPLAANTQRLRLQGVASTIAAKVLGRLQRLTHADVTYADSELVEVLLRHPAVQHVTVQSFGDLPKDLGQCPCRWRKLAVLDTLTVRNLASLPLAQLERLTVHGCIDARDDGSGAGMAALQRLHAEGRLVVRPAAADEPWLRQWRVPPEARGFDFWAPPDTTAAVVRLVVEAGQGPDGITCLHTLKNFLPISVWRDEVAPLLQQSGRITALCVGVWSNTPMEWCSGLLGALPPCISSVRVKVFGDQPEEQRLRALVQGGVASLTHPVTLTLLHWGGHFTAALEAELRQIVAGGNGPGGGGEGQQPLLTLEVAWWG